MNKNVDRTIAVLGGIGAGALLMYLMDPDRGRRRRALIRDKAVGLKNDVRKTVQKKSADLSNRAHGLIHEAKSLVGANPESEKQQSAAEAR